MLIRDRSLKALKKNLVTTEVNECNISHILLVKMEFKQRIEDFTMRLNEINTSKLHYFLRFISSIHSFFKFVT